MRKVNYKMILMVVISIMILYVLTMFFMVKPVVEENHEIKEMNANLLEHLEEEMKNVEELETSVSTLKDVIGELNREIVNVNETIKLKDDKINELSKGNEILRKELEKEKAEKAKKTASIPSRGNASKAQTWMTVNATAYTANCNGCSGKTATGIDVRDQSKDHRVIAVDPAVIPLGSLVEVDGYGTFIAADTGGAIKGHKIDILMQTKSKAYEFGRKKVQIRVIRSGYKG